MTEYKCDLCGARTKANGDPFTSVMAVRQHISSKTDEKHRGWGGNTAEERVSPVNDGGQESQAQPEPMDDESHRSPEPTRGREDPPTEPTGTSEGPSDPALPDQGSGQVTTAHVASCGYCGRGDRLVSQAEPPLRGESIKLRDGRVVDMTEGERYCTRCGSITDPKGEVFR